MRVSLNIDEEVFRVTAEAARSSGQPVSALVEHLLREKFELAPLAAAPQTYGEPWTEADTDEAAQVSFAAIDAEEGRATEE